MARKTFKELKDNNLFHWFYLILSLFDDLI